MDLELAAALPLTGLLLYLPQRLSSPEVFVLSRGFLASFNLSRPRTHAYTAATHLDN